MLAQIPWPPPAAAPLPRHVRTGARRGQSILHRTPSFGSPIIIAILLCTYNPLKWIVTINRDPNFTINRDPNFTDTP